MPEYRRPSFLNRTVMNAPVVLATKLGFAVGGANSLTVRGKTSGEPRTVPVNPLTFNGAEYLVAPRGETHWVRNLRAASQADLTLGRKKRHIRTVEVPEADRPAVIAAYLDRWGNITRSHFGTVKDPGEAELARLSARTPVFRVVD